MSRRHRCCLGALVACLATACSDRVPLGAFSQPGPATEAASGGGGSGGQGGTPMGGRSFSGGTTGGTEKGGAPNPTGGAGTGGSPPSTNSCEAVGSPGALNPKGGDIQVTIPHTDWTWPELLSSLEWDLTVETEPEQDGYFFTHEFQLEGGAYGLLGLQPRGRYQPDLSVPESVITNMVVFWLSAGPLGTPPLDSELGDIQPPDARTSQQTQKNILWQAINARYDFEICRTYRLRVSSDATDADGNIWYAAHIRDLETDVDTHIGRILVPAEWGKMRVTTNVWSNRIGHDAMTRCSDAEAVSAFFGTPSAVVDGVTVAPERSRNRFEQLACSDARFTVFPNGVRHELGLSD